jgi:hypothetical protein
MGDQAEAEIAAEERRKETEPQSTIYTTAMCVGVSP